jgi:hypothetical protein
MLTPETPEAPPESAFPEPSTVAALSPNADAMVPSEEPTGTSAGGDKGTSRTEKGSGGSRDGPGGAGSRSLFDEAARSQSVVYVIDRSGSMGLYGGFNLAKRELLASLQSLPPDTRFQVIFYDRHAEPLCVGGQVGLLPASDVVKSQVADLVSKMRPGGSTHHLQALQKALFLRPETILFVTDADDLSVEDVRLVTQANQGRSSIHSIELTRGKNAPVNGPLAQLARDNRGSYRAVCVSR